SIALGYTPLRNQALPRLLNTDSGFEICGPLMMRVQAGMPSSGSLMELSQSWTSSLARAHCGASEIRPINPTEAQMKPNGRLAIPSIEGSHLKRGTIVQNRLRS